MAQVMDLHLAVGSYPELRVVPNEAPNRLWAIPIFALGVKCVYLFPVLIWVQILGAIFQTFQVINGFRVFFSGGEYWPLAHTVGTWYMRLGTATELFLTGITEKYPGFSLEPQEGAGFELSIPVPATPSRGFAVPIFGGVVRWFLLIPFLLWQQFLASAAFLATAAAAIVVLIKGRYPESVYELCRDTARVFLAGQCYAAGLSDTYPSFGISMRHPRVKWTLIILTVPLVVLSAFAGPMAPSNVGLRYGSGEDNSAGDSEHNPGNRAAFSEAIRPDGRCCRPGWIVHNCEDR